MLTTCDTVVRRVGYQEIHWATGAYIAKVVQGALVGCVARGEMATSWAGGVLMVTAIQSQLWGWKVFDIDHTLGGGLARIHPVQTSLAPLEKRLEPVV